MVLNITKNIKNIKDLSPCIHCITNPISITQCANTVLGLGGRPIMAEHPKEVLEITQNAHVLLVNTGNITDVRMKAMAISVPTAKEKGIPVILDAVGVGCSALRREFVKNLIQSASPDVIKGNYSEVCALYDNKYKSQGVDADLTLDKNYVRDAAICLALKYNCVVLASGKVDIVTDGKKLVYINNGSPQLAKITGTGCMLGAICACCETVSRGIIGAVNACVIMGVCGSLAETDKGNGSFAINLMDRLSNLEKIDFNKYMEVEIHEIV